MMRLGLENASDFTHGFPGGGDFERFWNFHPDALGRCHPIWLAQIFQKGLNHQIVFCYLGGVYMTTSSRFYCFMSTVVVISDSTWKSIFWLAYLPAVSPKQHQDMRWNLGLWMGLSQICPCENGTQVGSWDSLVGPTKLTRCFSLQKSWWNWWIFWWEICSPRKLGKWCNHIYIYTLYLSNVWWKNRQLGWFWWKFIGVVSFLLRRSISWNNKELEDRTEFVRSVSQQAET